MDPRPAPRSRPRRFPPQAPRRPATLTGCRPCPAGRRLPDAAARRPPRRVRHDLLSSRRARPPSWSSDEPATALAAYHRVASWASGIEAGLHCARDTPSPSKSRQAYLLLRRGAPACQDRASSSPPLRTGLIRRVALALSHSSRLPIAAQTSAQVPNNGVRSPSSRATPSPPPRPRLSGWCPPPRRRPWKRQGCRRSRSGSFII